MAPSSRSQARVILARGRLHELDLRLAMGLEGIALRVLERVDPPDAAPFGVGLVERGGLISYVDGKRVGGDADRKPKSLRVRGQGVTVAVGFGFPGRFQEMGTVNHAAQPFLTPAVMGVVGDRTLVEGALRAALARALESRRRRLIRYGAT